MRKRRKSSGWLGLAALIGALVVAAPGAAPAGAQTGEPDLDIDAFDLQDPVGTRSEILYEISVRNIGTATAEGTAVAENVTALVQFSGARYVNTGVGEIIRGRNPAVLVDLGTIAPGGSGSFQIFAKSGARSGTATATVTVSTTSTETNLANNIEVESTEVTRQ